MPDVVGSAVVRVTTDASAARGQVTKAGQQAGQGFATGFRGAIKGLIAAAGVTTLVAGSAQLIRNSLSEARDAQKVGATTAQIIKTTGGAAHLTAQQVGELTASMRDKIGVDDEVIQRGANMLLTFSRVRNEVGKGNDVFNRATRSAADLAAAGFGSMESTSKQLGKALNDPIRGVSMLTRVGVTFTDQERATIKGLVEHNRLLDAQRFILDKVEGKVKGVAEAQATAGDKARTAWGEVQEAIGGALLPVVDDLANTFTNEVAPALQQFFTEMRNGTGTGGEVADVLTAIRDAAGKVLGILGLLSPSTIAWTVALGAAYFAVNKVGNAALFASAKLGGINSVMAQQPTLWGKGQAVMSQYSGALRNLAGAGGLVLLIKGLSEAEGKARTFETTLGGALLGLSVGGPVGLAVGGTAGLILGLATATDSSGEAAKQAAADYASYRDSLDQTTGAITELSAKEAQRSLKKTTAFEAGGLLGLTSREIIAATQGVPQAVATVNAALAKGAKELDAGTVPHLRNGVDAYNALKQSLYGYGQFSDGVAGAQKRARLELLQTIAQTKDYGHTLDSLPRAKKIAVEATGIIPTVKGIATVADKINATPTEVQTLISASGVETTVAAVQSAIDKGNVYRNLNPRTTVSADTSQATTAVENVKLLTEQAVNRHYQVTVNGETRDVIEKVGTVKTYLNTVTGKTYTVYVGANTSAATHQLAALSGYIRELTSKTHVVSITSHVTGGVGALLGGGSARGTVVNSPTVGLYGEAGPEAIVPLTPGAPLNPGVLEAISAFAAQRGIGADSADVLIAAELASIKRLLARAPGEYAGATVAALNGTAARVVRRR